MLQVEYLRHQSDALLRLSQQVDEPEVSAKLQELADELRIMISVADVTKLAADLDGDRPYIRKNYTSEGDGNGSGHGARSAPFSFTFLRSRRLARRGLVA